jgi:hypothetical protein
MSYVITAALFTVLGFIGGLLVFRKNQAKINEAERKAGELLK